MPLILAILGVIPALIKGVGMILKTLERRQERRDRIERETDAIDKAIMDGDVDTLNALAPDLLRSTDRVRARAAAKIAARRAR